MRHKLAGIMVTTGLVGVALLIWMATHDDWLEDVDYSGLWGGL